MAKHPVMVGRDNDVQLALADLDQIHRSQQDPDVLLFYRGNAPRWVCAVAKRLDSEGFLITAYPSDAVKKGGLVWKKSE